jgi:hypothetical protein
MSYIVGELYDLSKRCSHCGRSGRIYKYLGKVPGITGFVHNFRCVCGTNLAQPGA